MDGSVQPTLAPWRRLAAMATAYRQSNLLYTALELKVFENIPEEGSDAAGVGARIGLAPRRAELLLDCLAVAGLLSKDDSLYFNHPDFAPLLCPGADYKGQELLHHKAEAAAWLELTNRLTRTEAEAQKAASIEDVVFHSERIESYLRMVRAGNADHAVRLAERLADVFGEAREIMDLGGGHGLHAQRLLERLPNARVTVVDLEKAVEFCRREYAKSPLRERLLTEVGDARALTYEARFDAVMSNDLLHSFNRRDKERIVENMLRALRPGGRVAMSKFRLTDSDPDSLRNTMFSLKMFVNTHGGYLESDEETIAILEAAGAEISSVENAGDGNTVIVARKPAP